jgi:hypothetical protein
MVELAIIIQPAYVPEPSHLGGTITPKKGSKICSIHTNTHVYRIVIWDVAAHYDFEL